MPMTRSFMFLFVVVYSCTTPDFQKESEPDNEDSIAITGERQNPNDSLKSILLNSPKIRRNSIFLTHSKYEGSMILEEFN